MAGLRNSDQQSPGELHDYPFSVSWWEDPVLAEDEERGATDAAPLQPVVARSEVGYTGHQRVNLELGPQSIGAQLQSVSPRDGVKSLAAKEALGVLLGSERCRPR